MVPPYNSTDLATGWKISCFILSERLDFLMIDNLSVAVNSFLRRILTSLSVDEILLPGYELVNQFYSNNFRGSSLNVEMAPFSVKHMNCFFFFFFLI